MSPNDWMNFGLEYQGSGNDWNIFKHLLSRLLLSFNVSIIAPIETSHQLNFPDHRDLSTEEIGEHSDWFMCAVFRCVPVVEDLFVCDRYRMYLKIVDLSQVVYIVRGSFEIRCLSRPRLRIVSWLCLKHSAFRTLNYCKLSSFIDWHIKQDPQWC